MSSVVPFDFAQARAAVHQASRRQQQAEQTRRDASVTLAEKERVYREALARRIVELHADGLAWTVCQDVARGDQRVAHLRYERDVARGVLQASEEAAWRLSADRRDLGRLCEWAMRRDLAEGIRPHELGAVA